MAVGFGFGLVLFFWVGTGSLCSADHVTIPRCLHLARSPEKVPIKISLARLKQMKQVMSLLNRVTAGLSIEEE
jgi:hypothetical protein